MALFDKDQLYSAQGHKLTRSLFVETAVAGDTPIMTLSVHEKEGYTNLRTIFIELVSDDPSEYTFAEAVFGDYAHWNNITKASWMKPYLDEWRMCADVKRKAMGFDAAVREIKGKGRSAFAAAKFLIEEPWKDKRNPKTKEAVKKSTKTAASEVDKDVARLKDFIGR